MNLELFIDRIYRWQTLIGAFFGAMTPFLLWWVTDYFVKKKKYYDELYYLERVLIDQINNIIDTERVICNFIDKKLNELIIIVEKRSKKTPSIDHAFFPLFSNVSLDDEILKISTKSGYLDNKIAKVYQLSRDIPFIIEDVRKQFFSTVQLNEKLVLQQINPADVQKKGYIENLKEYRKMVEDNIIKKNFPITLKVLVQTWEAIKELQKIKLRRWSWRFDFKYKIIFFWTVSKYLKAKTKAGESAYDRVEKYFEEKVQGTLKEIEEKKEAINKK